MWFNQDLLEEFQYKNVKKSGLQGASDFIINASLGYSNQKENEFTANLTGNYSSDKIFALGSPEDFTNSNILFNDEIIEKGFFALDIVLSKELTNNWQIKLVGKNLLNPSIKQTQMIRNINSGITTNEVVSFYKKGSQFSLNIQYRF